MQDWLDLVVLISINEKQKKEARSARHQKEKKTGHKVKPFHNCNLFVHQPHHLSFTSMAEKPGKSMHTGILIIPTEVYDQAHLYPHDWKK